MPALTPLTDAATTTTIAATPATVRTATTITNRAC